MKIAIIGYGSIGKRHVDNIIAILPEISIFDIIDPFVDELNEEHKKDYTKLLKKHDGETSYDVVLITNPSVLHYETLKYYDKFTKKGFFIEKPLVIDETCDLSFLDSKVYYVACPLRHTKVLQETKNICENNNVISARAISSSYLPGWRATDYRKSYSAIKEEGGGVEIDIIHEMDYLNFLFGEQQESMSMMNRISDLEINSNDFAAYIIKYNQTMVELHLDYFGRVTKRELTLFTNDNEYSIDLAKMIIKDKDATIIDCSEERNDYYLREMKYFFNLLEGTVANINDHKNAIKTIKNAKGII